MDCPSCKGKDTKVVETRLDNDKNIRRRRECLDCGFRITTLELPKNIHLTNLKNLKNIKREFD